MIPSNAFTPVPLVSDFPSPTNEPYTPLRQVVMGGVALNDSSLGRTVRRWVVYYANGTIYVRPESEADPVFSMPASNVLSVSMAFDNNMALAIAWQTPTGANLYYYDTTASAHTTRFFPNVTSCRVCIDDVRQFYVASSDIIFAYTLNNALYWRQQRDRYEIERLVGATTKKLKRVGPNVQRRLQFELS